MQASTTRQRWFQTGGGEVLKSAGAFLLMLSLTVFIYAAYRSYALRSRNAGDVVGEPQEPNLRNAAARDSAAHDGSSPAQSTSSPTGAAPLTAPAGASALSGASSTSSSPQPATLVGPAGTVSTPGAAPATDTIAPNPPNGLAFGGAGHFQVYRQGDITWRLDTETGATCVLFATDAEWHQPRIRRAACRDTHR